MDTTTHTARGGDSLLAVMAFGVLVGCAAIAGLGVIGAWWLLPVAIVTLIALAVGVAYALMHVLNDEDGSMPPSATPGRGPA